MYAWSSSLTPSSGRYTGTPSLSGGLRYRRGMKSVRLASITKSSICRLNGVRGFWLSCYIPLMGLPAPDWSLESFPRLAGHELCDVYLESVRSEYRIPVIRAVRGVTHVGLKEAKDLVEGKLPVLLFQRITLENGLRIKAEIEAGFFPRHELKEWVTKGGRRRDKLVLRDKTNDPPEGTICCIVSIREYPRGSSPHHQMTDS
jgi:hypothetical protein